MFTPMAAVAFLAGIIVALMAMVIVIIIIIVLAKERQGGARQAMEQAKIENRRKLETILKNEGYNFEDLRPMAPDAHIYGIFFIVLSLFVIILMHVIIGPHILSAQSMVISTFIILAMILIAIPQSYRYENYHSRIYITDSHILITIETYPKGSDPTPKGSLPTGAISITEVPVNQITKVKWDDFNTRWSHWLGHHVIYAKIYLKGVGRGTVKVGLTNPAGFEIALKMVNPGILWEGKREAD